MRQIDGDALVEVLDMKEREFGELTLDNMKEFQRRRDEIYQKHKEMKGGQK